MKATWRTTGVGLTGVVGSLCLLASCNTVNNLSQPLGDASFDPLNPAGSQGKAPSRSQASNVSYAPGQWVQATSSASFFLRKPRGNANADIVLSPGTPMKVIRTEKSHLRVELDDGQVGYVPSFMVAERSAAPSRPQVQRVNRSRTNRGVPIVPTLPSDAATDSLPPLPEVPSLPTTTPSLPQAPIPPLPAPTRSTESSDLPDLNLPEIIPPTSTSNSGGQTLPRTPTPDLPPPLPPLPGEGNANSLPDPGELPE